MTGRSCSFRRGWPGRGRDEVVVEEHEAGLDLAPGEWCAGCVVACGVAWWGRGGRAPEDRAQRPTRRVGPHRCRTPTHSMVQPRARGPCQPCAGRRTLVKPWPVKGDHGHDCPRGPDCGSRGPSGPGGRWCRHLWDMVCCTLWLESPPCSRSAWWGQCCPSSRTAVTAVADLCACVLGSGDPHAYWLGRVRAGALGSRRPGVLTPMRNLAVLKVPEASRELCLNLEPNNLMGMTRS